MKNKIIIFLMLFIFSLSFSLAQEEEDLTGTILKEEPQTKEGNITSPPSAPSPDKISMDIKGMDILDVLKMLAMRANLNIIAGKNVTGRVTIFLKDAEVMDALEIILAANDLAYEIKGDIINVMTARDYEMIYGEKYRDQRRLISIPLKYGKASSLANALNQVKSNIGKVIADDSSNTLIVLDVSEKISQIEEMVKGMDRPLETKIFDLNYAPSDKLITQLQESITKGVGIVKMDERTNKIVVVDFPEKLADIEKIVTAFDETTRQVLIEARIVQVTHSDAYQMGIDWETMIKEKLDLKGMFSAATLTTGGKITIGTTPLTDGDYQAIINLLKTVGDTKVLSNPRITAISGQEAKILVGSKKAYSTSTVVQGQTTTQTAESVTFLDVGVKLYVTPKINKQGFVTMKIRPEVSSATDTYTTAQGNVIPIVETSEAETSVMVKDGVTIIIGGLIKDEKVKTVNKIPILGDIPLLGVAFSKTSDSIKRTELVIFLTPHLLSGTNSYLDYPTKSQDEDVLKIKSGLQDEAERIEQSKAVSLQRIELESTQRYYNLVRERIMQLTQLSMPEEFLKGRVEVSFAVYEDGQLRGVPKILESDNNDLNTIVINAIEAAAPFPAFPKDIIKDVLDFKLLFSYQ